VRVRVRVRKMNRLESQSPLMILNVGAISVYTLQSTTGSNKINSKIFYLILSTYVRTVPRKPTQVWRLSYIHPLTPLLQNTLLLRMTRRDIAHRYHSSTRKEHQLLKASRQGMSRKR
jgi:hypothetical protein